MEQWKEVLGYDILYEVSDLGRVRTRYSKYNGYTKEYHYLNPTDNGSGYLRFNFQKRGVKQTVYLHRLVAQYFIPNNNHFQEVNHKDENKYNNCVDNLEWCEHKYNCNYGTRNKRVGEKMFVRVKCVETGIVYNSIKEAAENMNVGKTAISNCLNGRSKTCSGYRWEYIQ